MRGNAREALAAELFLVLQPAYASLESLRRTAPTSRSRPPRGGSVHARGPLWSHSGVIGPGVWRSSRNGCARVPGPQERILGLQEIEWAILIARAAGTRMDTALPGPGPVNVLRLAPAHRDLRPTISSPSPRRGHRCASACIGGSITLRGFIDGIFADDHVIVPDHDRMLLRDAETCPRLRGGRLLRNSCASAFS